MIYECVINVSEGRNEGLLQEIADSVGKSFLDLHIDSDHNRSVFTLGSFSLEEVYSSAQLLVDNVYSLISFDNHDGVHPRLGLIDVVPFISYDEQETIPSEKTIAASIKFGKWINEKYETPVFYYDYSTNNTSSLPQVRKHAYISLEPSLGENKPHRMYGAVCIGAREPLLAINVNVDIDDLEIATDIAKRVRESSGGIKGVRALGLQLGSKVQISMNIVDTQRTNAGDVCLEIRSMCEGFNCDVELVGLVPIHQYAKWDNEFISWSNIDESFTVEKRLSS